jgi:hypothetical protein
MWFIKTVLTGSFATTLNNPFDYSSNWWLKLANKLYVSKIIICAGFSALLIARERKRRRRKRRR